MRYQKTQKIDLNGEYPCPCRRKGRLLPIILTEAMGCDRCQQIFVVDQNGEAIEQLSSTYPYKRAWRWTGNRWIAAHRGFKYNYLPLAIGIILVLLLIWLPLALQSPLGLSIIFWTILAILLAIVPTIMVWLAYRR